MRPRLLRLLLVAAFGASAAAATSAAQQSPPGSAASPSNAKSQKKKSKPKRQARVTAPREQPQKESKPKVFKGVCRVQKAKPFLKRESFVVKGQLQALPHQRAVKYRVEHYGRLDGVPFEKLNPKNAYAYAKSVRFLGLPIQVHEKVAPALSCVETRIRKTCNAKGRRYVPKAIGGFRQANTYRGGEVSNHLFGIAIDIDPERNPCCGCVDPWPNHRYCKKDVKKVEEKTELTACWIDAFERYGFYWLGRDTLEDTMHFEFLGDPERIIP